MNTARCYQCRTQAGVAGLGFTIIFNKNKYKENDLYSRKKPLTAQIVTEFYSPYKIDNRKKIKKQN